MSPRPPRARGRGRSTDEATPRSQLKRRVELTLLRDRAHYDALVMGAVFDRAFRQFADAFEKRADTLYRA